MVITSRRSQNQVIRLLFVLTACIVARVEIHAGDSLNVGQLKYPQQTQYQEHSNKPNVTDKSARDIGAELRTGLSQINSGHPHKSLTTFSSAREEARRRFDRRSEVIALYGLSDAYLLLRQLSKAEHSANESVHLSRKLDDAVLRGTALNQLGNVFTAELQFSQALVTYQNALIQAERGVDKRLKVKILINIMHVQLDSKDISQANSILRTAMSLAADLPNSKDKLYSLIALGYIAQRLNRLEPDKQDTRTESTYRLLSEALTLADELSDVRGRSYTLGHLSELYTKQNRYAEAERLLQQAIFLAEQADAPEISGQWYWQLGRLRLTQGRGNEAIMEYERALAEFDSIQNALIYGRRGHPQSYRETIGLIYLELAELLLQKASNTVAEVRQNALRKIRDVMEDFKAVELKNYFRDYCVTAQQEKNKALELDSLITPGTATLYPVVFSDRTVLLLGLADGEIKYVTVPVSTSELRQTAEAFRSQMNPSSNPRRLLKNAQKLYDWLIKPVAQVLKSLNIHTLVVVPDGVLRTVPFGALHDGREFLVNRYAIAVTPGLMLTDPSGFTRGEQRLLVNGLSESVQGFEGLPYVSAEVEGISSIYGGKQLINKGFVKTKVIEELERVPYSVISFSTHGFFHSNPKESFVLTYDGKLTFDELERFIRISEFRDQPVELIVLSACDTAIGDERVTGMVAG